jgi:hypothetical protein
MLKIVLIVLLVLLGIIVAGRIAGLVLRAMERHKQ